MIPERFVNGFLAGDNSQLDALLREIARISPPSDSPEKFFRRVTSLLADAAQGVVGKDLVQERLWNLALTDDMTGLHNRRAFFLLADQQLKLARRNQQFTLLFFMDIDGLKQINDCFGHAEGSRAITRVAQILKGTFRESDIIARLGGDEFAILANEATLGCEGDIWRRLNEALDSEQGRSPLYSLSLSIGVAKFDPHSSVKLEDLMIWADQAMYKAKRVSLEDRCQGSSAPVTTVGLSTRPGPAHPGMDPLEQRNAVVASSRNPKVPEAVGQFGRVCVAYQKSLATRD